VHIRRPTAFLLAGLLLSLAPWQSRSMVASGNQAMRVSLPLVTALPATGRPGRWGGEGCATPGGPCNMVFFAVSADSGSVLNGYVVAGRDTMSCSATAVVGGTFILDCWQGTVWGRFTSATDASGRYIINWPGFGTESADWVGSWVAP